MDPTTKTVTPVSGRPSSSSGGLGGYVALAGSAGCGLRSAD
ncbi:hypothetical protein [Streptomyces sp. NPDC048428]